MMSFIVEADKILRQRTSFLYTAIKLGQTLEAYKNFQNIQPDSEISNILEHSKDFSEYQVLLLVLP
jgi:hypothetical protein